MAVVIGGVTVYLYVSLEDPNSPRYADGSAVRDDSLRWTIALVAHLAVCILLLAALPALDRLDAGDANAAAVQRSSIVTPVGLVASKAANGDIFRVTIAHAVFLVWYTAWLGTLAYLNVATKFSRAAAAVNPDFDRSAELHEHARASNNSTALVALVTLSCFMRTFKLSYLQCVGVGMLLLICVVVSWVVEPPGRLAAAPRFWRPAAH